MFVERVSQMRRWIFAVVQESVPECVLSRLLPFANVRVQVAEYSIQKLTEFKGEKILERVEAFTLSGDSRKGASVVKPFFI